MIVDNTYIGDINVCDTYSNVVHISINISSLYSSSNMYILYDGDGYKIPFEFGYGKQILVDGIFDTNFKFNTDDVVFKFNNCEYVVLTSVVSTATINSTLTANQITVDGSINTAIDEIKIKHTGIVNHTLIGRSPHALSKADKLANAYDAVANYEYLSFKVDQFKNEFANYAESFTNPKDSLVVAYNNYGSSVGFKISKSQLSIRDKEKNKLTVVIIGTLVSYIGESTQHPKLYIKQDNQQTSELLQEHFVQTRASTGGKADAQCSINAIFLAVKEVNVDTLYTVYMECGGNINTSSIVVLCGEVIDYDN